MIINKTIVIHDKEYNLIYKTYKDCDNKTRASLKILDGKIHVLSLHVIRHGFIQVNCGVGRYRYKTVLSAKVAVLKHLTNS
jgi:hypothetical protein